MSRDTGAGRNALVISEFALALVLLIGAGLLIRSFSRLLQVVPGFQPANILTMRVSLSPAAYPDGQKLKAFYERLEDRLRALPGVVAIATANTLPLVAERANTQRFVVPGSPLMRPDTFPVAEQRLVTPDYFRTLGIPLRAGRQYTPADFNQPYIVVNETMARTFWPGEDPIGKKFISGPFGSSPVWSTVIGVVGDVKQLGLDSGHTNDFYYLWYGPTYLAVKTAGDPLALAPAIRREIRALDPSIPVSGLRTMEQVVDASTGERRFSTLLLSIFAAVALTLAVIGIYGIMSWSVEQRRREIGIRMAVGANARGIFGLVLARGLKLAFIGLTIGLAATLALTRLLTTLLFEISPTNPWILGGVSLLMLGVTVLACYVPARRAAEVDPMTTLRAE